MSTVVGGRKGRALGLKKICNCVFSRAGSLAGGAASRAAGCQQHRQTRHSPAAATQRLCRRFPGTGEVQQAAGKQTGSGNGQELGQADRQVGKQEENKEKNNLCPNISAAEQPFFFSSLIFLVDFSILLSFLSRAWLVLSSRGEMDCPCQQLPAGRLIAMYNTHAYIYVYMHLYVYLYIGGALRLPKTWVSKGMVPHHPHFKLLPPLPRIGRHFKVRFKVLNFSAALEDFPACWKRGLCCGTADPAFANPTHPDRGFWYQHFTANNVATH